MWEKASLDSYRGTPVRRFFIVMMAATVVAFFLSLIMTSNTFAIVDAVWNENSIVYSNNTYNGPVDAATITKLGLPNNTKAYTFIEEGSINPTTGLPLSNAARKAHVLYFDSSTVIENATTSKYKIYDIQGVTNTFSNPTTPIDVSINKKPEVSSTSCAVEGGMGWMICPITNFLANGMDYIFNIISSFLTIRPVGTTQDTPLFKAWSYMRSFANVAFVIAFLIIIYSQLTNFGISSYGIKKLLPRLIVAAILVNLSYYLCAIAVDISNILGYSIQDIFINIRNNLVETDSNSWDLGNFSSVTSFILSGGALGTAGAIGLVSTISTYGIATSIFLLLPTLLVGLFAVITSLMIMAARQAIVTIMIVLSPLAFVAYLLPNTEKMFEKWKSTMMTMLVLFPAFSVVFGGSQLASAVIIQNANSINIVILGMLVQVAPLFITPLLIKLGGGLLSKIAGVVNNPNKGPIDRARKYVDDRSSNTAAKRLALNPRNNIFGAAQRNAQRVDHNRRKRESWKKIHGSMADNRFSGSKDNELLNEASHEVDTQKKIIEQRLARDLDLKISVNPELLKNEMKLRVLSDEASLNKTKLDNIYEGMRAGNKNSEHYCELLNELTQRSSVATRDLALSSIASQSAKQIQKGNLSESLLSNSEVITTHTVDSNGNLITTRKTLRDYAGGIDTKNGADFALSFAVREQRDAVGKIIAERTQLMNHFALESDQYHQFALGEAEAVGIDSNGNTYTFKKNDTYAREAAIERMLAKGSFDEKLEIIEKSGIKGDKGLYDYRATISAAIPSNGIPNSGAFFGGGFINDVIKGEIKGRKGVIDSAAAFIAAGRVKTEVLAGNDAGAIDIFIKAAETKGTSLKPGKKAQFDKNIQEFKKSAEMILSNTELRSKSTVEAQERLQYFIDNF